MKVNRLYIIYFLVVLCFTSTKLFAQQNFFVYIQSEQRESFTATVNNTTFSSTPKGYLVIPKLAKGEQKLIIKPNGVNTQPATFFVEIENDLGFSLTKNAEGNWLLFNLQTLATVQAGTPIRKPVIDTVQTVIVTKQFDTVVIVQPKIDTPIVQTSIVKKIEPSPETIQKDSTISNNVTKPVDAVQLNKSVIAKITEIKTADQLLQMYQDKSVDGIDTISVLIPLDILPVKLVDDSNNAKKCQLATEDDFLKLRLQMAAASDEKAMISVAVKSFASKCFSVEQVKNLSFLFLRDENKYSFFISAKPAIYDGAHYPELAKQLNSQQYISQFKNSLP